MAYRWMAYRSWHTAYQCRQRRSLIKLYMRPASKNGLLVWGLCDYV